MVSWYQKKLAVKDLTHLMLSLAYFEDAESERMPKMLWDVKWRNIKDTIQRWVQAVK